MRVSHLHSRTHGNFNSKEVGMELAQSLLTLFDPTLDGMLLDNEISQDQLLIPIYTKPKTANTVLPGNIYGGYYTAARRYEFYFRVAKTIFYERAQRSLYNKTTY